MLKRLLIRLAILTVMPAAAVSSAVAESYPSRTITVVVPFSAGQSVDILARAFVQQLSAELGQPVIVNNVPGASGIIAFNSAAEAPADGYTLVFAPQGQLTIQPHLKKNLHYSMETFQPVCQVFDSVFAIIVDLKSPIRTFKDLVERAKAKPGSITWATSGIATVSDLQMTDLIQKLGLKMVHVTYRNYGQMIQDVIAGNVDFAVPSLGSFNRGTVHMVVLLADKRAPLVPDLPTIVELGYPVSQPGFGGLYAPRKAPPEVHAKLAAACPKVFASPAFQQVLKNGGMTPDYLPGDAFAKRLAEDSKDKAALISAMGLDKKAAK